ncbi:MAG: hypothetical protein H6739_15690 [Alphaproteobacteria bacterium]|nr:hypothetical protein [Alphaproteobacteria bacterium]
MPLFVLYVLLPYVLPVPPAPGLIRPKRELRNYTCERMSIQDGVRRYPGQVSPPEPRGDWYERSVVVCQERMLRLGLRDNLDDVILLSLEDRATELAGFASALGPALADHTWLVEVYYPSAPVSEKIDFATKNALMAEGLKVSDRAPRLGVGDVQVLTRMPPELAYPSACQRYYANGSLGEQDALLAVVHLDPRETALHAGLCAQGRWTWLR